MLPPSFDPDGFGVGLGASWRWRFLHKKIKQCSWHNYTCRARKPEELVNFFPGCEVGPVQAIQDGALKSRGRHL